MGRNAKHDRFLSISVTQPVKEEDRMNIMEFVRKSVAFGVGAAAFSAEKLKQFTDDMVARGEMTSEDATKFVDEMSKKAEDEKKTIQEWIREQMSKMLQQAGAAEAARVEALETRVAELEKRLAEVTGETEPAEEEIACAATGDEPLPPASSD
jgi:polyhydroxyalkanoate synthesis regulator phasin